MLPPPRRPVLPDLRGFGPVTSVPMRETFRAGLGAMLGLCAMIAVAQLFVPEGWTAPTLIAPFGACAFLLFAAPNSPLAQPWPTVVGNTVSALVAVLVCRLVDDVWLAAPLCVGAAICTMALCRATHPPGGAVAMTVALGADSILPLGFGFAFMPVALGSAVLVAVAAIYAPLTGRRYPLRQYNEPSPNGTRDVRPTERLGLGEDDLVEILTSYRQSLNLGVEDLARLLAAAELKAAANRAAPETASDIMSRDLVTVTPSTPLTDVRQLFVEHGFTSLPVVGEDGCYRGVIFQLHLIEGALVDPAPSHGWRLPSLPWSVKVDPKTATDIMRTPPVAHSDTPIGALLPMLAGSRSDAVPVLDGGRIVGIVTQTDLIAALARQSLKQQDAPWFEPAGPSP